MKENFAASQLCLEGFSENLAHWFANKKRAFPWRSSENDSPISAYAVWISEVMLQQTRAEVVIPYFLRWMKRFPDITTLAQAKEEEVIKAWEGLGYYARARRILQAAHFLIERHGGNLPANPSLLSEIPGFGPYTVGAVASFAFHQKAVAVDGNVLRFLSRFLLIREEISKARVQEHFRKRAFELLPDQEPWVVMEAMIELGATVCKKVPLCSSCPVNRTCRAFQQGVAAELPIKSAGASVIRLTRKAAVIKCGDAILVGQVPAGQVMAGLYEFPVFEGENVNIGREISNRISQTPSLLGVFDDIRYSFTRYQVTLQATLWEIETTVAWPGYTWIRLSEVGQLSFSSGHRRLCDEVLHFLLD